ncbi:hypothetical protein Mapa_011749 [Marchantia paleacea]|nr:hypothetical protein Mapa_011749 [Marchantia paleacea]
MMKLSDTSSVLSSILASFSTLNLILILSTSEFRSAALPVDSYDDILLNMQAAGDNAKFFSYMNSTAYMDGGNGTLPSKRAVVSGLSHMFHANSSLLPADCGELCVQRIRSKRLMQHLRANLKQVRTDLLSVGHPMTYIWLNGKKVVEWYAEIAVANGPFAEAQTVRLVPDTGSFFTWFQCRHCRRCYPQRTRIFNPVQNRYSFRYLTALDDYCQKVQRTPYRLGMNNAVCYYYSYYMDGTTSSGMVVSDTFRFYSLDGRLYIFLPNLGFGCGLDNHAGTGTGMSGVLGLGRLEGVSFPEQSFRYLGQSFSYCLPIVGSPADSGWLTIGDDSLPDPTRDPSFHVTALPDGGRSDTFYLDAVDMLVNGYRVYLPSGVFDIHEDRSGGIVIDSSTMITTLLPIAYYPFRDSYRHYMFSLLGPVQMPGKFGFDTCWDITYVDPNQLNLPTIGFLLRDGQPFILGRIASYFQYVSHGGRPLFCLPFIPVDTGDKRFSTLSGYSQMQIHMAYRYAPNQLIWANSKC